MGKKIIRILIILSLILVIIFLGFHFHDNIKEFIEDEGWIYVEPYAQKKVETANYYISGKRLFVIRENNLNIYDKNLEVVSKDNLNSSKFCYKTKDLYTVLASLDKHFVRLYKEDSLVWQKDTSLEIKSISVNKNGYVSLFSNNNPKNEENIQNLFGTNNIFFQIIKLSQIILKIIKIILYLVI